MPVDSDSAIAWHRAQLKKLRETLKNIEPTRFTVGELAQSTTNRQDAEDDRRTAAEDPAVSAHHRCV